MGSRLIKFLACRPYLNLSSFLFLIPFDSQNETHIGLHTYLFLNVSYGIPKSGQILFSLSRQSCWQMRNNWSNNWNRRSVKWRTIILRKWRRFKRHWILRNIRSNMIIECDNNQKNLLNYSNNPMRRKKDIRSFSSFDSFLVIWIMNEHYAHEKKMNTNRWFIRYRRNVRRILNVIIERLKNWHTTFSKNDYSIRNMMLIDPRAYQLLHQ